MMSYTESELDVFDVLPGTAPREGTAYIELHAGELPQEFACWLPDSVVVRDAGFDFVTECFYKSHPGYDYYAFVRFDTSKIAALRSELETLLKSLVPDAERDTLFARYASIYSRDIWDEVPTEPLRLAICREIRGLLEYLEHSENTCGVAWVLGM